mmetsp:Transcript_14089/g.16253  ORF Transcript_14089/g.16253 Transcript_14089/m.16253 type:complete len:230 (+) Transcript_14089:51-740(+)
MTEEGTTFDLPFQWDDGTFVSPFVRSAAAGLPPLGLYLTTHMLKGREGHQEQDEKDEEWVISDLGCGDGTALFGIIEEMQRQLHASARHGVHIRGVGYDLDAALVEMAIAAAPQHCGQFHHHQGGSEGQSSSGDLYQFFVQDLGQMSADDVLNGGLLSTTVSLRRHVVFVYLLTSALEVLQDLIEALLARVEVLISNSWSIPYLEKYLVAKVGEHWVYQWNAAQATVPS